MFIVYLPTFQYRPTNVKAPHYLLLNRNVGNPKIRQKIGFYKGLRQHALSSAAFYSIIDSYKKVKTDKARVIQTQTLLHS